MPMSMYALFRAGIGSDIEQTIYNNDSTCRESMLSNTYSRWTNLTKTKRDRLTELPAYATCHVFHRFTEQQMEQLIAVSDEIAYYFNVKTSIVQRTSNSLNDDTTPYGALIGEYTYVDLYGSTLTMVVNGWYWMQLVMRLIAGGLAANALSVLDIFAVYAAKMSQSFSSNYFYNEYDATYAFSVWLDFVQSRETRLIDPSTMFRNNGIMNQFQLPQHKYTIYGFGNSSVEALMRKIATYSACSCRSCAGQLDRFQNELNNLLHNKQPTRRCSCDTCKTIDNIVSSLGIELLTVD